MKVLKEFKKVAQEDDFEIDPDPDKWTAADTANEILADTNIVKDIAEHVLEVMDQHEYSIGGSFGDRELAKEVYYEVLDTLRQRFHSGRFDPFK